MDINRPLPQSIDAEKGLLGSILLSDTRVLDQCQDRGVTDEWFHHPAHQIIYNSFVTMRKEGRPRDLITVTQWLEDRDLLKEVGGAAAVSELFTFTPSASNSSYYLDILQEKAAQREALKACVNTASELYSANSLQSVYDLTTKAFQKTQELCVVEDKQDYDKKAMQGFLDEMEAIATGSFKPDFFPTSFPTIDNECGGLIRGEVLLIRGRKGTGKSLAGQAIIQHNVLGPLNRKAAIFTFEMMYNQYMRRLVSSHGRISLKSMRHGKYDRRELAAFNLSMNALMASNLRIYDTERLGKATPGKIFSQIRKHIKNHGLDMVMLDHLHLLRLVEKGKLSEKRTDELLHEFSAEFKSICLELKIAGILLAQENTEGGTFGGTQVETDVDSSLSLLPVIKTINNIKRIVGTDAAFCDKWREGDLLGRRIPLKLDGQFATLVEHKEVIGAPEF